MEPLTDADTEPMEPLTDADTEQSGVRIPVSVSLRKEATATG